MAGEYNGRGVWRANTKASNVNALRVDDATTGTPQKDTVTVTVTARTNFTGFEYTGKDGVKRTIVGLAIAKTDLNGIKDAIFAEVKKDENDTVIEVIATNSDTTVINHYGAGVVNAVTYDSTRSATSRGALP